LSGECEASLGAESDPCLTQEDCADHLACSYAIGLCVTQGVGSFCSTGCPDPARCASTETGSLCYGCHNDDECPSDMSCQIPTEDWQYDGGQCFPG
jgi:hypothetical protein